jgi:hypothetical protein
MTDLEIVLLIGLVVMMWVNHVMHITCADMTKLAERRKQQLISIAEGQSEIVKTGVDTYMWRFINKGETK